MLTFLKNWGAHGVAYVLSVLPIIQTVAPGAIPTYGPLIAGLAGVLLTAIHNTQAVVGANPSAAPTVAANVAKGILMGLLVGAVLSVSMGLSACSTLAKIGTPQAQPYVTAAVDVAVATAEAKGIPAAQINAISKTALAADSGTAATLATVASVVNAQLAKLNLPAGDLAAAQILEDALSIAIQAQVGANPNVATAQAAIADVLNAAIAATGG